MQQQQQQQINAQVADRDQAANDEYDRPKVHYVCGGKYDPFQYYLTKATNNFRLRQR